MSTYVFTGPTIGRDDAAALLDATYLPPVRQGDVYRLTVQGRARVIGIIDGYFQHVPSVWHKEILWAMRQGTHVFGSASMGALRAAELHGFGMRGVGRIFAAYHDGTFAPDDDERFEDDDEVAVIHGPPETGYLALSEAMVNIRCTMAAAENDGIVATATRRALIDLAKGLFFQDRTYDHLLALAARRALPAAELEALRAWLHHGRLDQKREDARAMLRAMGEFLATDPEPMRVDYRFEPTTMWDRAAAGAELSAIAAADGPSTLPLRDLLDELRLDDPDALRRHRRMALVRLLGLRESRRRGRAPSRDELRDQMLRLRRECGLYRRKDVERWLAENDLDPSDLDRLIEDEARLAELDASMADDLVPHLLDHLRRSGDYPRLAARARRKQSLLATGATDEHSLDDRRKFALLAWYFDQRAQCAIPDDLEGYVAEIGFSNLADFYRALHREHLYLARAGDRG